MSYVGFGKIPRLSRECVITEKLDGTNGQILVAHKDEPSDPLAPGADISLAQVGDYYLWAGSRNRWLSTVKGQDNHGFATWVYENAPLLVDLGPGRHFGEWWGGNIGRKYGLSKRFSLFNVSRWGAESPPPECCDVVPILARGIFSDALVEEALDVLRKGGSQAAPGFMDPEGVVIYHTASGHLYKKLLKGDELPKGAL